MALFKVARGDSSRISTDVTPFHDGWVYLTNDGGFYVDATINNEAKRIHINPKNKTISCILPASGWSGNTQTVAVPGLSADADGYTCLTTNISDEALQAATAANLRVTGQAEGQITVTAKGTVPTVDIPIAVVVTP